MHIYQYMLLVVASNFLAALLSVVLSCSSWLQADLGDTHLVSSLFLQGRGDEHQQWVTTFKLQVSDDASTWFNVLSDGTTAPTSTDGDVFQGNADRTTVVEVTFENPILTRHVRLIPITSVRHMSLRWEIMTCEPIVQGFTFLNKFRAPSIFKKRLI